MMGTDGLWDVTTDMDVADAVSTYLACCDPSDPMRYGLFFSKMSIGFPFSVHKRNIFMNADWSVDGIVLLFTPFVH